MKQLIGTLTLSLLATIPLLAHHSASMEFDLSRTIQVKGVVTRVDWTNPHARIYLEVEDPRGTTAHWQLEAEGGLKELMNRGWSSTTVKVGDMLSGTGHPQRQTHPNGIYLDLTEVMLADGTKFDATSKMWVKPPANAK